LVKKAQEEAKKILSKPKTPVISKDEIRQFDEIIKTARKSS